MATLGNTQWLNVVYKSESSQEHILPSAALGTNRSRSSMLPAGASLRHKHNPLSFQGEEGGWLSHLPRLQTSNSLIRYWGSLATQAELK